MYRRRSCGRYRRPEENLERGHRPDAQSLVKPLFHMRNSADFRDSHGHRRSGLGAKAIAVGDR